MPKLHTTTFILQSIITLALFSFNIEKFLSLSTLFVLLFLTIWKCVPLKRTVQIRHVTFKYTLHPLNKLDQSREAHEPRAPLARPASDFGDFRNCEEDSSLFTAPFSYDIEKADFHMEMAGKSTAILHLEKSIMKCAFLDFIYLLSSHIKKLRKFSTGILAIFW